MIRLLAVKSFIAIWKPAIRISDKLSPTTWKFLAALQCVLFILYVWGFQHTIEAEIPPIRLAQPSMMSPQGGSSIAPQSAQLMLVDWRMGLKDHRLGKNHFIASDKARGKNVVIGEAKRRDVIAFLEAIQKSEGGGPLTIVGGIRGNSADCWQRIRKLNLSDYPKKQCLPKRYFVSTRKHGLSTAAGSYQIVYYQHWKGLRKLFGYGDFSERNQAVAASELVRSSSDKGGKKGDDTIAFVQGDLVNAIRKGTDPWSRGRNKNPATLLQYTQQEFKKLGEAYKFTSFGSDDFPNFRKFVEPPLNVVVRLSSPESSDLKNELFFWISLFGLIISPINTIFTIIIALISLNRNKADALLKQAQIEKMRLEIEQLRMEMDRAQQVIEKSGIIIVSG